MTPHSLPDAVPETRASRRLAQQKPRRRTTVAGVLGELLITAGVFVLLFVVWQMWLGGMIAGAQNNAQGQALAEQWASQVPTLPQPETPADPETPVEPVILPEPADGEVFGVLHVPRFGADFANPIGGGVTRAGTLDTIGIGHYPGTQMPGQEGNFALAAHRTNYGGEPFYDIDKLQIGDPVIVETEAGWYVYRFRTLEYVPPTSVDVLHPVPQDTHAPAGERYLTMTSCYPLYTSLARVIGYSVFESFTPRADGPPAALTTPEAS